MVLQTKLKFRQRVRLRTSTKLAILFGTSSVVCITVALIFLFNVSNTKKMFGESYRHDEATGLIEVPQQKNLTSFEVKVLDGKNTGFQNSTDVQFKKAIVESAH